MKYDVIIVGAGPGGISAALYAERANLKVLVLYYGESQLEKAHKIDNYYGFEKGISGLQLYRNGIKQAENLGIDVVNSEVMNIEAASMDAFPLYSVKTNTEEYSAPVVVLATGNKKLRPNVAGIAELEGKGVSYCAVCDGFFYRRKKVCVIGDKRYALQEALHLANIAESVTILTNGSDAVIKSLLEEERVRISEETAAKIAVDSRKITRILGEQKVSGVAFAEGENLEADGVFVALGEAGGADFAKKIGLAMNGDSIVADEKMRTNAKGIYSCGNVNGGLLQVSKAVYEGAVAGLSAVEYLRGQKNGNK
ncbi:MAG: NAD(P)/FAD-dependent oxidoreductase [Treponema sp.]|nr:NAD(P)/FAD-dependent oxidoreductase [Treponema sp.]